MSFTPIILHIAFLWASTGFDAFVLSAWDCDVLIAPEGSRTTESFLKYTLRAIDLVTCDGENAEEMIRLRADSKKMHSVYPSADPRSFSPAQGS